MEITTVGLDLAKNVFQLHGVDKKGKTVLTKKLTRNKVLPFFANMAPCLIGMEATGSANHWARELIDFCITNAIIYGHPDKEDAHAAIWLTQAAGKAAAQSHGALGPRALPK